MRIPEKYRERYDRLAMSHPWMREMRDENHEAIEPIEKLRDWSKWLDNVYTTDDGKAYCVYKYKPYENMKSCGEYMRDLADSLADMVERDYVRWEKLDAEIKARDACARHAMNMEAERDEWKAKADKYQQHMWEFSNWHTATAKLLGIGIDPENLPTDEMIQDEIELRIIKLLQAEVKSAKRAAAVERLKNSEYHTALDDVCAMLGWGHEPHFEGATAALIDLLTDDDGVARSNDGASNLDWLCENDRDTLLEMVVDCVCRCPNYSNCLGGPNGVHGHLKTCREWLMAPHANDDSAPENDVSADDVDANDANATCNNSGENVTHDSREKHMALFDDAHRLECENKNLAIDLAECMEAKGALEDELRAVKRQLKQEQGQHSVTLNNWEQAKGKLKRERESLQHWKEKLDERDARAVEDIAAEQVAQCREKAEYWKARAEESWERLSAVKEAVGSVVEDMRALV